MNDNWEKEGLKYLERIFGKGLSLEEFEKNLEQITNKESMLSFFKNLINFVGISVKIGEDLEQNVRLACFRDKHNLSLKGRLAI